MSMEVKNNLRYFKDALKASIKSAMAYKVSFICQTLFMMLNNTFFLVFWGVVFKNTGEVDGVSFQNILYLWSFSTISFGVAYFFFGGVQNINEYIVSGQMDSYMLQPKAVLLNVMTSKCIFSAFGDVMYGIIIGLIVSGGDIGKFLMLLIIGIFGSIFFIATEVLLRAITVWVGDTKTIANKYTESLLITFSVYPEKIFSTGVKALLYTIIPAAYLTYMPTMLMENFKIGSIMIVFLVGIIYLITSIIVFQKAMKNYESGNNMSMKG